MHTNVASAFTIFGALDVEALKFLSSKIAGLEQLNAPISDKALKGISLIGLITFVIEDVPQFIIQVRMVDFSFYEFKLLI